MKVGSYILAVSESIFRRSEDSQLLTQSLNLTGSWEQLQEAGSNYRKLGATTECRATLDHLFYMCPNLLKNEV